MKNHLIYDLLVFHHLQIVFKINANCHFKTTFFLLHFQKWVALRLSTQKIWHSELVQCRRNLIKINFMPKLNVMQNITKIWFLHRNKWQMFFIRERNSPFCTFFWKNLVVFKKNKPRHHHWYSNGILWVRCPSSSSKVVGYRIEYTKDHLKEQNYT